MDIEKECTLLGNLFHHIVTDLKSSSPAWDDFVNKGTKLHGLLKSVTLALFSFTESIQKIADLATNTKGSTKDVGSALTRICVRQKMVENKLKQFTNSLMDNLICPVQDRLEEWKKISNQLEKDHSKDYKRATQEIKKRNSDTLRLQKKARKGSKTDLHQQLSSVMHDVNERYAVLEETEKSALRNLLVEERSRICFFANCLSPVLDAQVSILNETSHLNDLGTDMSRLCRNPKQLPTSTEQLVQDYIAAHSDQSPTVQDPIPNGFLDASNRMSPPSTPTSDNSRKSSICSLNSLTSSDSVSSGSLNRASSLHQRRYQGHHRRENSGNVFSGGLGSPSSCKSAPVTGFGGPRLSVSSHDSGFVSTGNGNAVQLPAFADVTPRPSGFALPGEKTEYPASDVADCAHPVIRGRSLSQQASGSLLHSTGQNRFSWKDWEKPGPYDKYPLSNRSDSSREVLPSRSTQPPPILTPKPNSYHHRSSVSEDPTPRKVPLHRANTAPSFQMLRKDDTLPPPPPDLMSPSEDPLPPPPPALLGNEEVMPPPAPFPQPHSSPTYVSPSHPYTPTTNDFSVANLNRKNSLNSLQYSTSSGYCSQYSTPACSEDAIPSQDIEFGPSDDLYCGSRFSEENFSTIPRTNQHGNKSKTLPRGGLQRHASANGLPSKESVTNNIEATGTATIRRKPSSKSFRRTTSGPKAVAPPTVPTYPGTPALSAYPMSFDPSNYNYNNNNSKSTEKTIANHSKDASNHEHRQLSVNRDLTLLFQQSPDHRGDSPVTTPVVGDPNHPTDRFYSSLPRSPGLDRDQN